MGRANSLSDGEFRIMSCIWSSNQDLTQALVMKTVNSTLEKKLNVSTYATYLRRMIRKGYLVKIDLGNGHPVYRPAITREEYFERNAQDFQHKWVTNSFAKMAMGCLARRSVKDRKEFAEDMKNQ